MTPTHLILVFLVTSLACIGINGCASSFEDSVDPTPMVQAQGSLLDAERLDVAVKVFDPGLMTGDEGVFPEVREAESRFLPIHLKRTLEQSGQWGQVWVTPAATEAVDVTVEGAVINSNWEGLTLEIEVVDAAGRLWLSKTYRAEADDENHPASYAAGVDPYQDLYNAVVNDMLTARNRLDPQQMQRLRETARMKFAAELAPGAFDGYLIQGKDGVLTLNRLPARGDPMMGRVLDIRKRERKLLDTLNLYYAVFYNDLKESYRNWQQATWREGVNYQRLKREGMWRKALGAAAIIGAIAAQAAGGSRSTVALRDFALLGGAVSFKSGLDRDAEARIHADAIAELGASLGAEAAPMTIEVEGQTRRLTGSAEAQYREWQRLLRRIHVSETGFTGDRSATFVAPGQ